jgi:hypothetical protein
MIGPQFNFPYPDDIFVKGQPYRGVVHFGVHLFGYRFQGFYQPQMFGEGNLQHQDLIVLRGISGIRRRVWMKMDFSKPVVVLISVQAEIKRRMDTALTLSSTP